MTGSREKSNDLSGVDSVADEEEKNTREVSNGPTILVSHFK
jgi:hypothetical protein